MPQEWAAWVRLCVSMVCEADARQTEQDAWRAMPGDDINTGRFFRRLVGDRQTIRTFGPTLGHDTNLRVGEALAA